MKNLLISLFAAASIVICFMLIVFAYLGIVSWLLMLAINFLFDANIGYWKVVVGFLLFNFLVAIFRKTSK